jgi:(p)ppGpp synthase/HD superfamily hydrolase
MHKNWLDHRRLAEAFAFAAGAHREQLRKDTSIPYVAHLMSVCALVLEHGGDEDQALAGLLHDVIEDGGAEYEPVIRNLFGERVAAIVRSCTNADVKPKPPWRERKVAYIRHLRETDPAALLVSACDKLHNARSIVADQRTLGDAMFSRFNAGKEQTLWYYASLTEVFQARMPGPLAEELAWTVGEMHRLAGA